MTCALGPYNFEFMAAVHREIVTRYPIDAIFCNRWAGHGQCWCTHCRTLFRTATGLDLPHADDTASAARRAYTVWRRARLTELWRHWDADIRRLRPDACYIPNGPPDMKTAGELGFMGMLTPAGPFVAMPIAVVMLRAGAANAPVIAYLTAWSLLALHRFVAWEVPILGWQFASLRYGVSLAIPVLAGLAARALARF